MKLNFSHLKHCLKVLEAAFKALQVEDPLSLKYDIYRAACVQEFELILEASGTMLKKHLRPYVASPRVLNHLFFKDIFRQAGHHGLLQIDAVERWLKYRDARNFTSHNYREDFAEAILSLLPSFISDTEALISTLSEHDIST